MGKHRRGHGEGSVYQRRDGYWVGSAEAGRCPGGHPRKDGTICTGGERRRARVVRRTKAKVLEELNALKRRAGSGVVGRDQTIEDLVTYWLDDVKANDPRCSETSLARYRMRATSWVFPYIGDVRARKLTTEHVRGWMRSLANRVDEKGEPDPVSPTSRNLAKGLLSSVLRWAEGEGKVERNVCAFVDGAQRGAKLDDRLSDDETEAVLTVARDDRLYALLFVSMTLGQRQGEMLALRWSQVDLEAGEMEIGTAKTRAGERTLPLVAGTLEILKDHRKRQAAERLEAGPLWHDNDLVFPDESGQAMDARWLLTWWHGICAKAGIERRRWHALRHSAATRLLQAGVPIEVVSKILGHAGIAITADIYARVTADITRKSLGTLPGFKQA